MNDKKNGSSPASKPRTINGFVVFALVAIGFVIFNYRPSVSAVYCDENTLSREPDVIMLGAWWCPYCYQARRYFQDNEISYCEYDIERSEEGRKMYDSRNGQGIPILLIGDQQLNGFDERTVDRLLLELHKS